jgi:hypothetical protein
MTNDGVWIVGDQLAKVPVELRKTVRVALLQAAEGVKSAAQENAAWSTRIPAAIKVVPKLTGRKPGVWVQADQTKAPHARTIEGITGNDTFRHPLNYPQQIANGRPFVDQATRPYLAPALRDHGDAAVEAIVTAVDAALDAAGFR